MKIRTLVLLSLFFVFAGCANTAVINCDLDSQRLGNEAFWVETGHYGKPTVKSLLIIPPTGGANVVDRSYAKMFCKAGYEVFILMGWKDQDEQSIDMTLHQRFYERSEKAISLVLAEIKSGQIGLLGTSVGALHAAVAASLQDRINAVFIITGGAPLADIIVNSDQGAMEDLANKRRRAFGFKNKKEYLAALVPEIKLEPMKLGDGFQKKKLGAVIALNDTKVPTEMQKNLVAFWNPQLVIEKDSGHFWTIVSTWLFNSDEILEFFENSFNSK